jgi:hypothetical protein
MARWTIQAGDSVLEFETTEDGRILDLDIKDGPFRADRAAVERIWTVLGAALTVMPKAQP